MTGNRILRPGFNKAVGALAFGVTVFAAPLPAQLPPWQMSAAAAVLAFLAVALTLKMPMARARLAERGGVAQADLWPRLDKIVARERALRGGGAVLA